MHTVIVYNLINLAVCLWNFRTSVLEKAWLWKWMVHFSRALKMISSTRKKSRLQYTQITKFVRFKRVTNSSQIVNRLIDQNTFIFSIHQTLWANHRSINRSSHSTWLCTTELGLCTTGLCTTEISLRPNCVKSFAIIIQIQIPCNCCMQAVRSSWGAIELTACSNCTESGSGW